jgi:hypothetical protein
VRTRERARERAKSGRGKRAHLKSGKLPAVAPTLSRSAAVRADAVSYAVRWAALSAPTRPGLFSLKKQSAHSVAFPSVLSAAFLSAHSAAFPSAHTAAFLSAHTAVFLNAHTAALLSAHTAAFLSSHTAAFLSAHTAAFLKNRRLVESRTPIFAASWRASPSKGGRATRAMSPA